MFNKLLPKPVGRRVKASSFQVLVCVVPLMWKCFPLPSLSSSYCSEPLLASSSASSESFQSEAKLFLAVITIGLFFFFLPPASLQKAQWLWIIKSGCNTFCSRLASFDRSDPQICGGEHTSLWVWISRLATFWNGGETEGRLRDSRRLLLDRLLWDELSLQLVTCCTFQCRKAVRSNRGWEYFRGLE